jgi:hypothetical protein
MSTNYNGKNANVIVPAAVQIVSSTFDTPIVITTYTAHGLASGDTVNVYGHAGNFAANGEWAANVLSTTTFALYYPSGTPSVGTGVGTTSGFVQSLALGATYPIPSDGDLDNAASVNGALEALGDRTAMLSAQIGKWRELDTVAAYVSDATGIAKWAGHSAFAAAGAYEWCQDSPLGTTPILELTNAFLVGDVAEVQLTSTADWGTTSSATFGVSLALGYVFYASGTPSGPTARIPGSACYVSPSQLTGVTTGASGVSLRGRVTNTVATNNSLAIFLMAMTNDPTPTQVFVALLGDYQASFTVARATSFSARNG